MITNAAIVMDSTQEHLGMHGIQSVSTHSSATKRDAQTSSVVNGNCTLASWQMAASPRPLGPSEASVSTTARPRTPEPRGGASRSLHRACGRIQANGCTPWKEKKLEKERKREPRENRVEPSTSTWFSYHSAITAGHAYWSISEEPFPL